MHILHTEPAEMHVNQYSGSQMQCGQMMWKRTEILTNSTNWVRSVNEAFNPARLHYLSTALKPTSAFIEQRFSSSAELTQLCMAAEQRVNKFWFRPLKITYQTEELAKFVKRLSGKHEGLILTWKSIKNVDQCGRSL